MRAQAPTLAALALLGSGPALAAGVPGFKVFGAASYVAPLGEEDVSIASVRDSVQASDELGWNVGLEARVNRLIGIELDYVNATNDIEFGGSVIGAVHMQPLSLTLNVHVLPTSIVDVYVGPTASYFIWGDAEIGPAGSLETDDGLAFGASLGVEIGLGRTFALLGGVRWLKADLSPEGAGDIGVDPLFTRLGAALRF